MRFLPGLQDDDDDDEGGDEEDEDDEEEEEEEEEEEPGTEALLAKEPLSEDEEDYSVSAWPDGERGVGTGRPRHRSVAAAGSGPSPRAPALGVDVCTRRVQTATFARPSRRLRTMPRRTSSKAMRTTRTTMRRVPDPRAPSGSGAVAATRKLRRKASGFRRQAEEGLKEGRWARRAFQAAVGLQLGVVTAAARSPGTPMTWSPWRRGLGSAGNRVLNAASSADAVHSLPDPGTEEDDSEYDEDDE